VKHLKIVQRKKWNTWQKNEWISKSEWCEDCYLL